MSIAQQLYHLQTLDQEIEAGQQSLQELIRNLGESQAIIDLRASLASEKQHLEALQKQQHSLEWEAGDITTKLKAAEEELYSGRIHNPKELSNLQRDIELLKANRSRIEDKILELMEQSDSHNKGLTGLQEKYARVEAEWRLQQQQLEVEIKELKSRLSKLDSEKSELKNSFDSEIIELYEDLKMKRKTAVARVTQGICSGCRMQLPIMDLQRVRGGKIVQCSSCGRILYLP